MPVFELESAAEERPFDEQRPRANDDDVLPSMRAELDQSYAAMREFDAGDVVDIFMHLAAFSARASELRTRIVRVDNRRLNAFRSRELDPFLEEVDRQFKVWSRIQAVRQMEADLTRGL